ncbi:Thiamine diphosphokinase [Bertholletia excelsa]
MACKCNLYCYSTFTSLYNFPIASPMLPKRPVMFSPYSLSLNSTRLGSSSTLSANCFTWDDVITIARSESKSSDLNCFLDKIKFCNRGSVRDSLFFHLSMSLWNLSLGLLQEKQREFMHFIIEDQIVGYVHNRFADQLRKFQDVFIFSTTDTYNNHFGDHVCLHPILKTPEDRTRAVADVIKFLGEELIPNIRNELYPVTSTFGSPVFFSLERAAAPYFGIKAYGVHMNGYVEKGGQKYLWIGKRSKSKQTYPGMLDHVVAGGLPHDIACGENLIKECEEEAGIPSSIAKEAIPVGAVSYMDIEGYRYKRDVLFCYDLKLPKDFVPNNQDGEVESFKLIPLTDVANIIRETEFFKPNCNLVIIDFLFRQGYFRPEEFGYLKLLQSLRSGDCS